MFQIAFAIVLAVALSGCMSPMKDPAYINYLNYSTSLKDQVDQGNLSVNEALKLDQQAYQNYLYLHNSRQSRNLAVSQAFSDMGNNLQNQQQTNYIPLNSKKLSCTSVNSGGYTRTDCY